MNSNAIAAKKKVDSAFMKKGVFIAIMSGVTYGLYTGFLTWGMTQGYWAASGTAQTPPVCLRSPLLMCWLLWAPV